MKGKIKMKFYDENGERIDKVNFIEYYSKRYYLGTDSVKSVSNKSVFKNSEFIESKIDELLKDGIKNENDIVHILAWKTGKILHKDSEQNKKFEYYSSWSINEVSKDYQIKIYNRNVDVKTFAEYIVKNITSLEFESKSNPQEVLNKLKNEAPSGIGTVYLITLLYFISKGEYPIYDKFATMAINAICNDKKPYNNISYSELPDRNSTKFKNVITICNKDYVNKLRKVFGEEYKNNRDIDRALWVYGHLFANKKGKGCC